MCVAQRRLGRACFLLHRPITLAEVQNMYIIHQPRYLMLLLARRIVGAGVVGGGLPNKDVVRLSGPKLAAGCSRLPRVKVKPISFLGRAGRHFQVAEKTR